jgi:hypothetical protein
MSFLMITDPAKRDLLVQELIKTRKNILQDSIDERVGEIDAQQSLSKLFKLLTEKIETTTQAIKALPVLPAPPPLAAIAPPPLVPAMAQAPSLAQASIAPVPDQTAASSQLTTDLGEKATAYFKRSHASAVAQSNVVRAMSASYGKSLYSTLRSSQTP